MPSWKLKEGSENDPGSWVRETVEDKWMVRYEFPGSGGSSKTVVDTREEGEQYIRDHEESTRKFWQEKVEWEKNGNRVTESPAQKTFRIGGRHYAGKPGIVGEGPTNFYNRSHLGFGGHLFRWRYLGEETVYESNNVYTQGAIPEEWRELLPDNAEFV